MFSIFKTLWIKWFEKSPSPIELSLPTYYDASNVFEEARILYTDLQEKHFKIFYTKYFEFSLNLPNIHETLYWLREIKRRIEKQKLLGDFSSTQFEPLIYNTEDFFYRSNLTTYTNKYRIFLELKEAVVLLVDTLNAIDDTSIEQVSKSYYERHIKDFIYELNRLANIVREHQ